MKKNVLFGLLVIGLAFNLMCCASSSSTDVNRNISSAPSTIPVEIQGTYKNHDAGHIITNFITISTETVSINDIKDFEKPQEGYNTSIVHITSVEIGNSIVGDIARFPLLYTLKGKRISGEKLYGEEENGDISLFFNFSVTKLSFECGMIFEKE